MQSNLQDSIKQLQEYINSSANIVFFGGAGVSTESGIPDFRSQNGLYNQQWKYPPEQIINHSFFMENTKDFYKFYREKMIFQNVKPNIAHIKLAELEKKGKLKAVITQNIDGLHQMAGSKNVFELHGSILRNYCTNCQKFYDVNFIVNSKNNYDTLPHCTKCGSLVKPDVVLYEESLDNNVVENAISALKNADMLIIGGTSLVVYPAASLINYFCGNKLVLINKSETSSDNITNLVIHESIGKVLEKIVI